MLLLLLAIVATLAAVAWSVFAAFVRGITAAPEEILPGWSEAVPWLVTAGLWALWWWA